MKEELPALTQPSPSAQTAAQAPEDSAPEQPGTSAAEAPPTPVARPPRSAASGLAFLLAVLAAGAAALAGWQAWQTRAQVGELRDELARRLAGADTVATESRTLSRQQQDAIATLQGKLGALEAKVADTEGQATALEALYQEFSRSREDRVMAEVEQAVTIAGQQLMLAGNVEAALIALQGADARLASLDRGQLAPLRRALAHDIEQLRAQPQVDVQGIAGRLEGVLERVDALPLAYAGELPAERVAVEPVETSGEATPGVAAAVLDFSQALANDLWQELKTLVRVERLDQSDPVLLAPAQSAFLRENVKIRLLTARLALLARDGRGFEADLAQARGWIERFFDARDERVAAVVAELKALEATPVVIEHGATLDSVGALRLLQARGGNPLGARPAAPAPESAAPAAGE
ncbi:hypothetical protein E6C76_10115 [Pseudothauera nasutitermitis]|uniref:Uroporphyrin-3 C-methyltransferase n=1 Tax=Pseudothauera nasutitermitis TaxID=2565930 RepID=A0A4S4B4M9_9RHOO|nr:uroporphyrinogen-III C-methyltransferase [Pseudothauera nasutitermitis]THF65884.1 hypothetical protein E6C76_10115 [Pseudothauera nasutitermitis]